MDTTEPVKLTLKLKTIPIELEQEDGLVKTFVLQELTGAERDVYVDLMVKRVKTNARGEPTGIRSAEGMQAQLLARCLRDEDGGKLEVKEIQNFPSTTLNDLFDLAQELNGLGEEAEDQVKND